jgi:hypothetical protein
MRHEAQPRRRLTVAAIPGLWVTVAAAGVFVCVCVCVGVLPRAQAQVQGTPIEDYVAFTRSLPAGLVTVGDLGLPPDFLRRVADRSLRGDFRRRRRGGGGPAAARMPPPPSDAAGELPGVTVVTPEVGLGVREYWEACEGQVPPLRGFRAVLGNGTEGFWPVEPADEAGWDAAAQVARSLVRDGLVRTTLDIFATHHASGTGPPTFEGLRSVGLPVDLLDHFTIGGDVPARTAIDAWWRDGADPGAIDEIVASARFRFRRSCPGFVAGGDDGGAPVAGLRLQLPTNRYALGAGDGSTLDVVRQLAELPESGTLWISIRDRRAGGLLRQMSSWALPPGKRVTIVGAPARVPQWAQDDAEAGTAPIPGAPSRREPVLLIPRYPNRNEQMTKVVAADALALSTLDGIVGRCVVSPLLFQGGNLLVVHDRRTGERTLLVGEAEVHRNRALGLTWSETIAALAAEMGVDRCVVLPAVSFHIDMELTVRSGHDGPVACVSDDGAAARRLLEDAVAALLRSGDVEQAWSDEVTEDLERGAAAGPVAALRRMIYGREGMSRLRTAISRESGAEMLGTEVRRILLALDLLTASLEPEDRPTDPPIDEDEERYLDALARRRADRVALRRAVEGLGWRVEAIPNLGDEEAGANLVNAIHLPQVVMIPAIGGFCAGLDAQAREAFGRALGPETVVIPITTTHVQTMYGGLHCMVSVIPAGQDDGVDVDERSR